MKKNKSNNPKHIVLTSYPPKEGTVPKMEWEAKTLKERGPLIASMADHEMSNVVGAYAGAYSLYRAVAVAVGELDPLHVPDLTNTAPPEKIGPHDSWFDPDKIVSLDPWGHMAGSEFEEYRLQGLDVRPTIAVTKAHINMPEIHDAIAAGRLKPDGKILKEYTFSEIRILPATARDSILDATFTPSPKISSSLIIISPR